MAERADLQAQGCRQCRAYRTTCQCPLHAAGAATFHCCCSGTQNLAYANLATGLACGGGTAGGTGKIQRCLLCTHTGSCCLCSTSPLQHCDGSSNKVAFWLVFSSDVVTRTQTIFQQPCCAAHAPDTTQNTGPATPSGSAQPSWHCTPPRRLTGLCCCPKQAHLPQPCVALTQPHRAGAAVSHKPGTCCRRSRAITWPLAAAAAACSEQSPPGLAPAGSGTQPTPDHSATHALLRPPWRLHPPTTQLAARYPNCGLHTPRCPTPHRVCQGRCCNRTTSSSWPAQHHRTRPTLHAHQTAVHYRMTQGQGAPPTRTVPQPAAAHSQAGPLTRGRGGAWQVDAYDGPRRTLSCHKLGWGHGMRAV